LVWLSENYDDSIVYKLDKQMRSKTYSEDSWKNLTGKDIDSLWLEYSGNSEI
ncbi:basic secretory protein-like protein, partial [Zunongwangia profunda]